MPSKLSAPTLVLVPGRPDPLASWDTKRQARYTSSGAVPSVHFLLDASGSMYNQVQPLLRAYHLTLWTLRPLLSPLTQVEVWAFRDTSELLRQGCLGTLEPLTAWDYTPSGDTRLKRALANLLDATTSPGLHVLIVLSDGMDAPEDDGERARVRALMTMRQAESWLCIYLGAFPEALGEALAIGFHEGNTVTFSRAHLLQAFAILQKGLQRFLTASAADQKLLAATGIFPDQFSEEISHGRG